MRGKEEFACKDGSQVGITPAYAGKSKVMSGAKDKRMGSPPRMRGKGAAKIENNKGTGITPAYAGKSGIPVP